MATTIKRGYMDDIKELKADVKKLLIEVAEIKTLTETAAERCPYRELIFQSATTARRLSILEKFVYGGAALGTVITVVLKAIGVL